MLLLGAGPRALLLQLAHPLVAAGVAEHSDFRADPWRRLDGTLRSYLRIIYGSTHSARAELRRLNALHRSVVGAGYAARDPELSLWVHATLVDSTLAAYSAWLEPVPRARAARFYEETMPIAQAMGVPRASIPDDLDLFEAYLERAMAPGGPIRVGPVARGLAEVIVHPPLPGPLDRARIPSGAYDWTMWPALGLLPPTIRQQYGFAWGLRERWVSGWLVLAWRTWRPIIPPVLRTMPQALAADRRITAGEAHGRDRAGQ